MSNLKSTKLRKLEFSIFRERPSFGGEGRSLGVSDRVLVAVSSGADSVALLYVLSSLRQRWNFKLEVTYVHHGERGGVSRESVKTNRYRAKAEKRVVALAKSLGLPVVVLRAKVKSKSGDRESEDALRDVRMRILEQHAKSSGAVAIALGHHGNDLFETRLIRLIRGTGPQGLLAMSKISASEGGVQIWRPLLTHSRADIEMYLTELGLRKNRDWIEDPSNRDARYLRNDLRRRLIPMMDRVRPGGSVAMARSLQLLVDQIEESSIFKATHGHQVQFLERAALLALSPALRRSHFANWLRALEIRGISQSQIDEILKRIDTRQKRLSFEVGGRVWIVDTEIRVGSTTR